MEPLADKDVKSLAAIVANLPTLTTVDRTTLASVASEYRRVAVSFIGPEAPNIIIERFRSMSDESALADLNEMQEELHTFLPQILPSVRLPLSKMISVPIGADVTSPARFTARFVVQGHKLTYEMVSTKTNNLALAMLDDMWRRPRRCPLWACESCRRVIVQPARGRTARFCSARCKARRIPSAVKRAEYVARHRERRRQQDLAVAVRAIEGVATHRQYQALSGAFRTKPRRALLHLLKVARAQRDAAK